jgi:hypothetical protein
MINESKEAIYNISPAFVGIIPINLIVDSYTEFDPRKPFIGAKHIIQSRVVVTKNKIIVIQSRPDKTEPYLAYESEIVDFVKSNKRKEVSYAKTKTDELVAMVKDEGCGCGSKLKGINIYKYL